MGERPVPASAIAPTPARKASQGPGDGVRAVPQQQPVHRTISQLPARTQGPASAPPTTAPGDGPLAGAHRPHGDVSSTVTTTLQEAVSPLHLSAPSTPTMATSARTEPDCLDFLPRVRMHSPCPALPCLQRQLQRGPCFLQAWAPCARGGAGLPCPGGLPTCGESCLLADIRLAKPPPRLNEDRTPSHLRSVSWPESNPTLAHDQKEVPKAQAPAAVWPLAGHASCPRPPPATPTRQHSSSTINKQLNKKTKER